MTGQKKGRFTDAKLLFWWQLPPASHIHTLARKQARTDAYMCVYIYVILFLEKILESDCDSKYIQSLSVMPPL